MSNERRAITLQGNSQESEMLRRAPVLNIYVPADWYSRDNAVQCVSVTSLSPRLRPTTYPLAGNYCCDSFGLFGVPVSDYQSALLCIVLLQIVRMSSRAHEHNGSKHISAYTIRIKIEVLFVFMFLRNHAISSFIHCRCLWYCSIAGSVY